MALVHGELAVATHGYHTAYDAAQPVDLSGSLVTSLLPWGVGKALHLPLSQIGSNGTIHWGRLCPRCVA